MEKIKYFFECYFNQSADYADIENLIKEYKDIESAKYVESIISELEEVQLKKNWNEFADTAYKAGGRLITLEKCVAFVDKLFQLFKSY